MVAEATTIRTAAGQRTQVTCFFKTLVGKEVTVELKNELSIRGKLQSVDQYLNFKLDEIEVEDKDRFPQLLSVKNIFIRGSVIRYVHIPPAEVDTELLQDATRREIEDSRGPK